MNIDFSEEKKHGDDNSFYNIIEGEIISKFIKRFLSRYEKLLDMHNQNLMGIISPYKLQVSKLKNLIYDKLGEKFDKLVEIETVDSFQGREKDIIMFSSVRTQNKVGFLKDYRRMNVALTRSKHLLVIFGRQKTLNLDDKWSKMISKLSDLQSIINIDKINLLENDLEIDKTINLIQNKIEKNGSNKQRFVMTNLQLRY